MKAVLHIGCGQKSKQHLPVPMRGEDWREVRYDISEAVKPDIVGDIRDMAPVETGSMDALFSSHNIEHVYFHEIPGMFAEFVRVLKPETGFAVITCPDLQCLGEALAAGEIDTPLYTSPAGPITPLDIIYGHRSSVANGETYMAHKTGYTAKLLARLLKEAGFAMTFVCRARKTRALWALATRTRMTEAEIKAQAQAYFTAR